MENKDIFRCPVECLMTQYFEYQWRLGKEEGWGDQENDSMATFDTCDLGESLVDETEGIDREWCIEGECNLVTGKYISNLAKKATVGRYSGEL